MTDTLPADHAWAGDDEGHNCAICVERGDTLNMCWPANHLSNLGEMRVGLATEIGHSTGITEPERLLRLADAVIGVTDGR